MMQDAILWLGKHFSAEQYLYYTRIQCLAWTAADLVLVFYLLRLANLARRILDYRPHRLSYAVLAATVSFVPFIASAGTGGLIFALELLVTAPHFLIILYVIVADFRSFPRALSRLLTPTGAGEAPDEPGAPCPGC